MISSEQEINYLLATITLGIRQSLDLKIILETTVQEIRRIYNCDRVVVYYLNSNRNGKIVAKSIASQELSNVSNLICNPYLESAWISRYQQGEIVAYEDFTRASIPEPLEKLLQHFGIKASLTAPILQSGNVSSHKITLDRDVGSVKINSDSETSSKTDAEKFQLWGLLIAHHCQNSRKWSESEKNLFRQIADQIAIAVQQANLLQRNNQEIKQKQIAERETKQTKEFLQNVIDHLPIAVYVKDASQKSFGKFKLWNQATEKIFEIEAPEVIGKTVYDHFASDKAQKFLQQDLEVLETRKTLNILEECNNNGQSKLIHKVKVPLYNQDRQPQYLLCIAEDITQQKKAEQELKRKSEELAAFSENLKLLHRLNTTNYANFAELFQDHLQTGCQMFNCSTGVVGLIKGEYYEVYAVESDLQTLAPKQQFLLKDTFCVEAVKTGKTVTHECIGKIESLCYRLPYKYFKFESYIGTPIFINGSVFGTLSFASGDIRTGTFSDREKETIEMMAQSIGRFICADRVEKKRQETAELLNQSKKELEVRVLQRTAELEIANYHLQSELHERQQAQFALQESQDSLRESERRWRSLLESVRLLVVGINNQGNVTYVNPYFLELTGYTKAEVLWQNWFDKFVHPQEKTKAQKAYQSLIKGNYQDICCQSHHHQKTTILTKSQEAKTIALNVTQLCDLQGISIGIMCIGEDITKRQAIEKMKDEFISVVSHELRTPLTSIRGALGLLATGALSSKSEKGSRIVKIAADSTEHLVRLVDDILELERLDSGKIELFIQKIKLQDLISQAVEQVQIFAQKQKIELKVTQLDGEFDGDYNRIVQVLTNLLSNAIKFSESSGTVKLDVEFGKNTENPPQSMITFAVGDRGRGIPADQLESIFERFHQVDASDSRGKGGTGLGLAICRTIVEQHGGKIWVESIYGEGATFYFNLPILGKNL